MKLYCEFFVYLLIVNNLRVGLEQTSTYFPNFLHIFKDKQVFILLLFFFIVTIDRC